MTLLLFEELSHELVVLLRVLVLVLHAIVASCLHLLHLLPNRLLLLQLVKVLLVLAHCQTSIVGGGSRLETSGLSGLALGSLRGR